MDLRQLKYFMAIYELRNLSHAADHCNVAQSAVSHHLSRLEDELGTALFKRRARGMDPTAAGERLYEHAVAIFSRLSAAEDDVKNGGKVVSGEITVGMPYSVIKVIGVELMKTVRERYPAVTLVLKEALSGIGFDHLVTEQCEFSLLYNPPQDDRIRQKPLLDEQLYFIGHPSLLSNAPDPLEFKELTRYPLMLLSSGSFSRALMDKPQLLHTLERASTVRLASVAATIGCLEAAIGCTIAPQSLVPDQLEQGTLISRRIINPAPWRTLYLAQRTNSKPTFLSEKIAELVEELAMCSVTDGRWPATMHTNR
ncbi:Transcriptional regulator [Marinobacterium lacunae]|uniref:Transcriptional regulator n=1 Tax=Marinobacterium lacunae TaxID=1232683 RepID=A0A081G391_9GAMM|nr:LysR family transcriptional regulator [Marinobacterium lacunae]KEA65246.1 Transcriptional regulator [Marinobacterium lacunae]